MEDQDFDTPSELELRPSQLDPSTIGVYCKKGIRQGARFGPLLGERLQDIPENTNPEYLLKVVDKDSRELVFYVDASDTNTSNWMRCIQGCKSPKDQNVMPQRDGSDIYLTATKDLSKGSEILVWFEETAKTAKDQGEKDDHIKTILICWGEDQLSPKRMKKERNDKKSADEVNENANDGDQEDEKEDELDSEGDEFKSGDEDDEEEGSSIREEGKYQFELQPQHTIKSRLGRKVFQCDICSGVYRHAFSLKRHYIRNHINYRYVSKADLLNCQINTDSNAEGSNEKGATSCENDSSNKNEKLDDPDQCLKGDFIEKSTGSDKENSDNSQEMNESSIDKAKSDNNDSSNTGGNNESGTRFIGLFRCNVCGQLFDTIGLLKSHISHHPDIPNLKAYSCDSCDMKFTHKQNLMRHQAVHTGAKPYLCKFCGKKFPTATNQKRHERIHLGRRISCEFCSSSFTQSGDLKKHIRKLHPECFHECAFCGKYFSSESILEDHLGTHEETLVSNLEEATRRRHAFKVNMEQDMAESMRLAEQRPGFKYACTVCKKRFHDYANMCRHRRLAHQRHLLISKRNGKLEEEEVTPVNDVSDDQAELDPHSYFFANVARNIAENLKYFVEGGQDNLNNPDMHIKWKVTDDEVTKAPEPVVLPNSECSNYSVYNFPKGFEPKSNFHKQVDQDKELHKEGGSSQSCSPRNTMPTTAFVLSVPSYHVNKAKENTSNNTNTTSAEAKVPEAVVIKEEPLSNDGKSTEVLNDKGSDTVPNDSSQSPPAAIDLKNKHGTGRKSPKSPAKAVAEKSETKRAASPISVPKVRICSICHCIFHKADLFKAHMKSRHKVDVNIDDSQPVPSSSTSTTSPLTSPTLSSPPQTPLKSPKIPFASYQTKSWDGSVAAIDLSNNSEAQMYDFNGALDLTSPTKKSPPTSILDYPNNSSSRSSVEIYDNQHSNTLSSDDLNTRTSKFTCGVCSEDYPGLEALQTHQRTSHANVSRDQLDLMGDFNSNWTLKPNPVGLLNVCTSQIPTAEDYASANVKYTCTKCKAEFIQIGDLHNHIVECAVDYIANARPHQPKSRLKFAKGLGWVSSRHNHKILASKAKANQQVKKKVKRALLKTIMTRQSEVEDDYDILPRRRSLELLYNPSKHVRRREMTEVLDMHRCRGCGYRFATISLLERHVKVCTQKDRIKELQVMKPTLRGASSLNSLSKRHMCHYCKKNFTYIGGLKKHIFDICSVRKQIKEKNGKLEQSWEDSIVAMLLARDAAQDDESFERCTRKRRGRRKNHRWGYGKKKKSADAAGNDQEADDDDEEDDNRDDESVTSLVSKESMRTDTSNSNVNNDYMDDDNSDDDDSKSGVLVIDIKDEEEEDKSMDFDTEGLTDQINGKVSPGVIRAHVEHLQHKDGVNMSESKQKGLSDACDVLADKPGLQRIEKDASITQDKLGAANVDEAASVDGKCRANDDLLETSSKAVAARALIDLQSSTDLKSSPTDMKSSPTDMKSSPTKTTVTYSTLKVPDLSGRSFRQPVSKQPKKAKTNTEPKTQKAKSPTKQKSIPSGDSANKLSETGPVNVTDADGPKTVPKTASSQVSDVPLKPAIPVGENSPKGKKETMKRKSEEESIATPAKKTLTRSKSKNANESKPNEFMSTETSVPLVTPQKDTISTSATTKAVTDNSSIRIKTGSKVKAVTLASPKVVTSAAMKLIVPSPGRVSATAGGASVKRTTVTAIKAKAGVKQAANTATKTIPTASNKEKAPTSTKEKAPAPTIANVEKPSNVTNNKAPATASKVANKKIPGKYNKDVETNNQDIPEKKPAKKGGRGRATSVAAKAAEKVQDAKTSPKKTSKRSSSTNVTPDPTPPPSPAKKNPKRRSTRAS